MCIVYICEYCTCTNMQSFHLFLFFKKREPKEPIILYDPSMPPDMPPPFDYPPHHGYGGGRGRGRGGRGGGRMVGVFHF